MIFNDLWALSLPVVVGLLLCFHLGYAWATILLPTAFQPWRLIAMPLIGCALLVVATASLTLTTALPPPLICAGLAGLMVPLNLWALLVQRRQRAAADAAVVRRERWPQVVVAGLALLSLVLTLLPNLLWGMAAPIGRNWDPADFYIPIARALEERSQRDVGDFPRNPVLNIIATPPVSGRVHGFSFLHATLSRATGIEPLRSFTPMLALTLALLPLAVYLLGHVLGLARWFALLAAALSACSWLLLHVAYNGFAEHLQGLVLLPGALALSVAAFQYGGRGLLALAALATAGLATAYFPALALYVASLAPIGLWLLFTARQYAPEARYPWLLIVGRAAGVGVAAILLSMPTQASFFLEDGFLGEIQTGGTGFSIRSFVPVVDLLGLEATFHGEKVFSPDLLVVIGIGVAVLLVTAALLERRSALIIAAALGCSAYLGVTFAQELHHAFWKGLTIALPIVPLLLAAGAQAAFRVGDDTTPTMPIRVIRGAAVAGVGLLLVSNLVTIWRFQERYSQRGPQLWPARELEIASVREALPRGVGVLVVPDKEYPRTFYSLVSYALLGNELFGRFPTAYSSLSAGTGRRLPEFALIPEGMDPSAHGYQAEELRWAGAGMRLYGRGAGVRYHRTLGRNGQYPVVPPGETVNLRIGPRRVALPGEGTPERGDPADVRLVLALASFGPGRVELQVAGQPTIVDLPIGLFELPSDVFALPGAATIRNLGTQPIYLWWAELRDPEQAIVPRQRDEVFYQIAPSITQGTTAETRFQLQTAQLPTGAQRLTALLTVAYNGGDQRWREIGQFGFFPGSDDYRIGFQFDTLQPTVTVADQILELFGSAAPAGDGDYQLSLLLANNAEIVAATTLWKWQIRAGQVTEVVPDSIAFEIVPLPRAITSLDVRNAEGTLRLRGLTLAQPVVRPGAVIRPQVVWQALQRMGVDYQARLRLVTTDGQDVAQAVGRLGATDHGTARWIEGELAAQTFELTVPPDTAAGEVRLVVELLAPDGQPVAWAEQANAGQIATLRIVR